MKKTVLTISITFLFIACGMLTTVEDKMKNLELGMTKSQTISILGTNFYYVSAQSTDDGKIERISYPSRADSIARIDYIYVFKNDTLIEWYKDERHRYFHNGYIDRRY